MLEYLDPEITMALPGFTDAIHGREALIASFEEFCENAKVIQYEESDESIEVIGVALSLLSVSGCSTNAARTGKNPGDATSGYFDNKATAGLQFGERCLTWRESAHPVTAPML